MAYIPLESVAKGKYSYYKLVLAAAERANELLAGCKPLIETDSKKHTTIALKEICEDKVNYAESDDGK